VRVEALELGSHICALDVPTGDILLTPITCLLKNYLRSHHYVLSGSLRITNDHPVMVCEGDEWRWVRVDTLRIGDAIRFDVLSGKHPDVLPGESSRVHSPRLAALVIPAQAGIQNRAGFRVKPGMTTKQTETDRVRSPAAYRKGTGHL
jgi:hypothetical protein